MAMPGAARAAAAGNLRAKRRKAGAALLRGTPGQTTFCFFAGERIEFRFAAGAALA
jgi:hypothetical protein